MPDEPYESSLPKDLQKLYLRDELVSKMAEAAPRGGKDGFGWIADEMIISLDDCASKPTGVHGMVDASDCIKSIAKNAAYKSVIRVGPDRGPDVAFRAAGELASAKDKRARKMFLAVSAELPKTKIPFEIINKHATDALAKIASDVYDRETMARIRTLHRPDDPIESIEEWASKEYEEEAERPAKPVEGVMWEVP